MSLETIKKALGGEKINIGEVMDDVKNTIAVSVKETEEKGKAEVHKRNDENNKLRVRVKKIEGLVKKLGVDVESEDLEKQINEIIDKAKAAKTSDVDIAKMKREIETLKETNAKNEAEKKELSKKNRESSTRAKIAKGLKGEKIKVVPEMEDDAVNLIMANVNYDDEGKASIKINKDIFDLSEGPVKWLESKKHYQLNTTKPGAGGGVGGGGGAPGNTDLEKMSSLDKLELGYKT